MVQQVDQTSYLDSDSVIDSWPIPVENRHIWEAIYAADILAGTYPKQAREYADFAEVASASIDAPCLRAESLYWVALLNSQNEFFGENIADLILAAKISEDIFHRKGEILWQAKVNNLLGILYERADAAEAAQVYQDKALSLLEQISDIQPQQVRQLRAEIYHDLGNIYEEKDKARSESYFRRAREIFKELGNSVSLARLDLDQAGIFLRQKKYQLADQHYMRALEIGRIEKNQDIKAISLENLSYLRRKQFEQVADMNIEEDVEAEDSLFYEGVGFAEELLDILPESHFRAYIKLGKLFSLRRWYTKDSLETMQAYGYYLKAFESASEEKDQRILGQALDDIVRMCRNPKSACFDAYNQNFTHFQFEHLGRLMYKLTLAQIEAKERLKNYELLTIGKKSARTRHLILWGSLGVILVFALIFILLYQEAQAQKINARMAALRSQINPHFVSNTINAIEGLVITGNKEAASEYLSDFAYISRRILYGSREGGHTLEKEIDLLKKYLGLLKLRFEDKIAYLIEVDPSLSTEVVKIPAMVIQPFVENAYFHGVNPKPEGGTITIRFNRDKEYLLIEVDDDGIGRKNAKKIKKSSVLNEKSHGMAINEERIESISRSRGTRLEIIDKGKPEKPLGTLVKIKIPYREISA
ncbi:MAG: histidine kinase [Bacteroidota bacterium]